jgi:hypothetical protein
MTDKEKYEKAVELLKASTRENPVWARIYQEYC